MERNVLCGVGIMLEKDKKSEYMRSDEKMAREYFGREVYCLEIVMEIGKLKWDLSEKSFKL